MKTLIFFSLFLLSTPLIAGKGYILKKSSLECYKNGKSYTLKNNVVINFTDEQRDECFGRPFYDHFNPFGTSYNQEPQNDIHFKIKGHSITCVLSKGKKPKTTKTMSVKFSQDLLLFKRYDGQTSSDKKTLKQWASFDSYGKDVEGRYSDQQELPYSFENGKPTIHPQVLKGEKHFGHGTERDTRQKFWWYMKGKSSQIQITEKFNYVEKISCSAQDKSPGIGSNLYLEKNRHPSRKEPQDSGSQTERI